MTEKSTFTRRVHAARTRATKHEARHDVVSRLVPIIHPPEFGPGFLAGVAHRRARRATTGNADAMTIREPRREVRGLIGATSNR